MSRRNPLGRRRADWIIPVILLLITSLVALWAINNRLQKRDAEVINQSLKKQVELQDRTLKHLEQKPSK